MDHAALKFKIKGTEFFVVNVGAILHVKYKTWVDGDTWMATLKNGIQTAQALDQKLYTVYPTHAPHGHIPPAVSCLGVIAGGPHCLAGCE